jgi:acetoacetyl-CoA synthetase
VYDELGSDTWLFSMSGGTEVCTAFLCGVPTLPVHEGELQARALGCDVQTWDEQGRGVTDAVGELVLVQPMPSMPLRFWNDEGDRRYRSSYFDTYPGVWRHGDWARLTPRGSAVLYGRSDATINRGGVRMGTSEIYRSVLGLEEIDDALVVDIPRAGQENWMPLFVVLRPGTGLNRELRERICRRISEDCSPRHVPDDVYAVASIPKTLSGKLLELPVKRVLMGTPPGEATAVAALSDPGALEAFAALTPPQRDDRQPDKTAVSVGEREARVRPDTLRL